MKRKLFLVTVALFLFNALTFAQQATVKGKVTADDGMPLPGATVVVKGTSTGTVADLDGNYTLNVEGTDAVLVFSFIGYVTEEVALNGQATIDMILAPDISDLDEVVVVGYGVQKKSLVTGAISKLSSDDLLVTQPQRVEQAIQGKVSGVTVASNSGSPGAGMSIKIRGSGSDKSSAPIFIVDGMRTGGIDYLDPADIESIEILKDAASAAIYGAQGGNGVVLVTTKKGKAGQAQVTYNMYYGTQRYVDKLSILDADQYVDYYQKAYLYENQAKFPDGEQDFIESRANRDLTKSGLPELGQTWDGPKTNWLEEITSPAPVMSHSLGISGGSEKSTYSGSVNYFTQDGITGGDKSHFERMTARLNMDHQATDYLKVGFKATYSHRERKGINENNEYGGIYGNAVMYDPLIPVTYDNEEDIPEEFINSPYGDYIVRDGDDNAYGMSSRVVNEIVNPLAQLDITNENWGEDKILAGAFAEIEIIEGLKFRSSYDVDLAHSIYESYSPVYMLNTVNNNPTSYGRQNRENWHTWQFDNVLSYSKDFGEHSIGAMVGTHAEESTHKSLEGLGYDMKVEDENFMHPAQMENLPVPTEINVTVRGVDTTIIYDQNRDARTALGGENFDPRRLSSVFGRLTYNFGEKYMLNYTLRQDKSSMLDPDHNKGNFHSISGGWVVSKESFWTIPFVNFLKLRYSYGQNGNLGSVEPFEYVSTIGYGYPYINASGTSISGAAPTALSNPLLGWETGIMHNVGADFRMLESKVSGSIEYYKRISADLLTDMEAPGTAGAPAPQGNNGEVVNSGLEIEISYKKFDGDFQYDVGGNISFMNNEVTDYIEGGKNGAGLGVGGTVTRIDEGFPMFYFYGYETDGVWESIEQIQAENTYIDENGVEAQYQAGAKPGDIRIINQNGDSIINNDDKTMIGSPHPDIMIGFNFNAYYKNFDFGISMSGAYGQEVYMGIFRNDVGLANRPEHFLTEAWSPDNTGAEMYRPTVSSAWNFAHNDQYVENGGYLKVKNITLGYTLPKSISDKAQISKARIYVAGNNLLTFTKYRGSDPEMGQTQTNNEASLGIDRGFYPQARTFLIGLNVTF